MIDRLKAGPVELQERIGSIDILRGFAVLGILVMNIQYFSMVAAAYFNPTVYGDLIGANWPDWDSTRDLDLRDPAVRTVVEAFSFWTSRMALEEPDLLEVPADEAILVRIIHEG